MKMYLSKYALSKGIEEVECKKQDDNLWVHIDGRFSIYKMGRDIHLDKESAVSAAMEMRARKIESLKKQIKKLEKMTFA